MTSGLCPLQCLFTSILGKMVLVDQGHEMCKWIVLVHALYAMLADWKGKAWSLRTVYKPYANRELLIFRDIKKF